MKRRPDEFSILSILLVLILNFSCSVQKSSNEDRNSSKLQMRPSWINEPYLGCTEKTELCAIGEGSGTVEAISKGRRQLALIFKASVKGRSKFFKSQEQTVDDQGGINGSVFESAYLEVEEITDEVIKGSRSKKTYIDELRGVVYSLISLDKRPLITELKSKRNRLDNKMMALTAKISNRRSAFHRLKILYNKRLLIDDQIIFLSDDHKNPSVSWKDIENEKDKRFQRIKVFINLSKETFLSGIEDVLKNILIKNDFVLVTKVDEKHDYELVGTETITNEPINVKGFLKNTFIGSISMRSLKGILVHNVDFSVTVTGRNMAQLTRYAIEKVSKKVKENFNELNI
ncbi:LPP20 family lipoprotein [Bacteriovoracaceae bacterium]|nr:LPP20 family lipoprotein [Bacteriovoracaceae bacterium]